MRLSGAVEDTVARLGLVHQSAAAIIVAGEQRVVQGSSDLTSLTGRFNVLSDGELVVRHIDFASLGAPHVASASYAEFRAYGGAIAVDSGKATVNHCVFRSNVALTGGAVRVFLSSYAVLC